MKSRDIRRLFIEYFVERGHTELPSSSLIPPPTDTSLLLTNAGMNQIVPYFLGLETPPNTRLTSIQKCFRTVDIDEVGDESHNTMFEMLGNFSVGDYFKREAMRYAWDLLTGPMGIAPDRLMVTVYPEDEEARQLWQSEIGLTPERIFDDPSNIWIAGDSGPCGPDSEIYCDRGEQYGCGEPDCGPNCPRCDRYLEIWNLVFIQWYQEPGGSRRELARKHIDTGMGLERISLILQDVPSIFETDLFVPVVERAAAIAGTRYTSGAAGGRTDRSLRIIADHGRSVTFLVADGVRPGNEGRGYVLRRVLRRAVRHGRLLGVERPFLGDIADTVIDMYADQYPELRQRQDTIKRVIAHEEEAFGRTLTAGISRFDELVARVKSTGGSVIPGEDAFRLYDTYGFPPDLTRELAEEVGLTVDEAGFEMALQTQRERSRASARAFEDAGKSRAPLYAAVKGAPVTFLGYDEVACNAVITDILGEFETVEELEAGAAGELVLDRTVFYGESGGQVGDTGTITTETGVFTVTDTVRPTPNVIVHRGSVSEGYVRVGQPALAAIDAERRAAIRRNHTATHLLHRALRIVLGEDTHQAGSLVAPDRLRFDFTSTAPLGQVGIERVTELANRHVLADEPVEVDYTDYQTAVARGAMALFGEKYGDVVRVVSVDDFSAELCGGTHVRHTGEIGPIVILSESSIGSGVRRIEALTGEAAIQHLLHLQRVTTDLARSLRTTVEDLPGAARGLQEALREREREIEQLRVQMATSDVDRLLAGAVQVDGTSVLAARVDARDRDTVMQVGDRLRDKLGSGVIVLGSIINEQPALVAMVTKDLVSRGLHAGKLVQEIAPVVGGRGGGRPDVAQGGGTDVTRLDQALAAVQEAVKRQVNK
jgi:alanyl-tRNA synthetase